MSQSTKETRLGLKELMEELSAGINKLKETIDINFQTFIKACDEGFSNSDSVAKFKANDTTVRGLGDELENLAVKILSLQAPVGKTLRTVMSSFRMIYDLQRISRDAFHAYSRMVKVDDVDESIFEKQSGAVKTVLLASQNLLNTFIETYNSEFDESSKDYPNIITNSEKLDDKIDELFDKHTAEMLTKTNNGELNVESGFHIMSSFRFLERVGDHCCNLIERALYIQTGNKVIIK